MRPPERISGVLQEVETTWKHQPKKTFAAVICDAVGPEETWQQYLWGIEDDELVQGLISVRTAVQNVAEQSGSENVRRTILEYVERMWSIYPDWRLGQMLCNLSHQVKDEAREIRDMTDAEMVNAVRDHFKGRAALSKTQESA